MPSAFLAQPLFFPTLQINGSVNVTCNKLMLQNLNAEQSWHQGDGDYIEPIEMIAVVTESLTGMWLCEVCWGESRAGGAGRPYCCVEELGTQKSIMY